MLVESGEDTDVFVAFDSAMFKLTGVRAAEVANPMEQGEQDPIGYHLPQFLKDIVGNTYIFHLKLTEFNFSGNHKSFIVLRIFDPNDKIPGPSFAPHGGGNNPDDDMHGNKCASSRFHVGGSSGGNSSGGSDDLKDSSAVEETIASSEHQVSISENAHDDAPASPEGNPTKKARNA
ncbi:hypothetical protein N665_0060s0034 [Sinapis alba]|nr:hypothetical protein N665_0060s0034 [Sinapis alba]KAF8112853.1 hypothetical protein N665_0060s0034 [Sinapis alba]